VDKFGRDIAPLFNKGLREDRMNTMWFKINSAVIALNIVALIIFSIVLLKPSTTSLWPFGNAGAHGYASLWQLAPNNFAEVRPVNGELETKENQLIFTSEIDPQLLLTAPEAAAAACTRLQVTAALKRSVPNEEPAQLFYMERDDAAFDEDHSVAAVPVFDQQGVAGVQFDISASSGFAPNLRLDPGSGAGTYQMQRLDIACLS
jgi:hypothetical protein